MTNLASCFRVYELRRLLGFCQLPSHHEMLTLAMMTSFVEGNLSESNQEFSINQQVLQLYVASIHIGHLLLLPLG